MLSAEILELLHLRLQQILLNFESPFGGINIIFCGDLRQLPAVKATPIYKRCRKMLCNQVLWQSLQYYNLTTVIRQKNSIFYNILGNLVKLGNGKELSNEETIIIENRFINTEEVNEKYPHITRLF